MAGEVGLSQALSYARDLKSLYESSRARERELELAEGNVAKARLHGEMARVLRDKLYADDDAERHAKLAIDIDPSNADVLQHLQRLAAEVRQRGEQIAAERGVGIAYEVVGDVPPKDMDAAVKHELQAAADASGVKWIPMVSGAGHDSQVMGTGVPTAMLFVPSVEGRSHSAAEYTSPEDAARGATVLAAALHRIAF